VQQIYLYLCIAVLPADGYNKEPEHFGVASYIRGEVKCLCNLLVIKIIYVPTKYRLGNMLLPTVKSHSSLI